MNTFGLCKTQSVGNHTYMDGMYANMHTLNYIEHI